MDKKNTMLLTVIAVATLLVAVVGATFAYFAVTNPSAAETQVGVTAGKIGAVEITNNTDTLKLHVTTEDMKKGDTDTSFYVVKSDEGDETTTGGIYKKEENSINIATIKLTGADDNDTVKCQISVKVDLSGTMAGNLKTGDLFLTLDGGDYEGFSGVTAVDLSDPLKITYSGETDDSKTGSGTFTGTGTIDLKNSANKTINAKIWLVNDHNRDQQALAGKELTIKLTTQLAECTTVSPKAAA